MGVMSSGSEEGEEREPSGGVDVEGAWGRGRDNGEMGGVVGCEMEGVERESSGGVGVEGAWGERGGDVEMGGAVGREMERSSMMRLMASPTIGSR